MDCIAFIIKVCRIYSFCRDPSPKHLGGRVTRIVDKSGLGQVMKASQANHPFAFEQAVSAGLTKAGKNERQKIRNQAHNALFIINTLFADLFLVKRLILTIIHLL